MERQEKEFNFIFEFRKRKEKTVIEIKEEEIRNNPEKILQMFKKESIDLKSWFYVILFYYSMEDYANFKRFSEELARTDVDLNPWYRDQKQTFIYILNIFSFFYSHLAQKSKDKEKCDNFSTLSTTYVNQAEKISLYDPMTIICKGFLFFAQGDYDNSEMYFSNISDSDKNTNLHTNIVILAKLGRALNAYNKVNYPKAIEYYVTLIRDYDYINENILESLGICYYNIGQVNKANEIFLKVLDLNPHNYKVQTYLSILELSKIENDNVNFDKISDSLHKIKEAFANDEENDFYFLLIHLANIFLIAGKIQQADEVCVKLNNLLDYGEMRTSKEVKGKGDKYRRDFDEIKSSVYCINGKLQHFKKNNTEAFTWYRKAVGANAKNIEAQFGLGQILLAMNNLMEAEKCFEACKSIQEGNNRNSNDKVNVNIQGQVTSFEINKYLAFIYARTRRKEVDSTVELFRKALEIKNNDTDCFLELAQLLEFRKPEESLKLYEEILVFIRNKYDNNIEMISDEGNNSTHNLYNIDEILPEILNNIATIKIRLHLFNDVDKLLQEALNIIKARKEKLTGEVHTKHHPHESEELVLKLNSLEQSIYFNLALFKEAKCEFDEAYKFYKQIIKLNPFFVEAYVKLGELARLRGNKKKAMEYIQMAIDKHFKAEKENPNGNNVQNNTSNNLSKNLNPSSTLINNLFPPFKKIISVMKKPIDPSLIMAQILLESGNENDALNILHNVLKQYDEKDPYTLVFMGNIFYEMAAQARGKEDFTRYLNKSLEMYYYCLEADKYNAYAAIGVANILAEYNITTQALENYKLVLEKMNNNHNAFVNEALINMNENKYEKASIILTKLLKRFFKNKCPEIENILAKCLMEIKDFDRAFFILKGLIFRFPDNIYYKFNYALCLKQKAEEILLKPERLVRETEVAISCLDKSIPIFEALFNIRRETFANFKNEKDERALKTSDFYNKCSEVLQFLHVTLINAKETLDKDKVRESDILYKIEENRIKYSQMLENMKEVDEQQREEIKRKVEENEKLSENYKSKFEQIILMKAEKEKKKEKVPKKGKGKREKEEEFVEEGAEIKTESEVSGENIAEEERRKKPKKFRKHKKRPREEDEEGIEDAYVDPETAGRKVRKLRKKHRAEDDIDLFEERQDEENVYEGNAFNMVNVDAAAEIKHEVKLEQEDFNKLEIITNEDNNNNNKLTDQIKNESIVKDVEMKDYTKNELEEEEVDFS